MVLAAVSAVTWVTVAVPVALMIARLVGRDDQRARDEAEWTRMLIEMELAEFFDQRRGSR